MSSNSNIRGYQELNVWQKGMILAKTIYQITNRYPSEEKFGLISQMRRAAVSIPSNLAEGQARHTTKEFIQFISLAEGSLAELHTQLLLSIDLNFIEQKEIGETLELMDELRKMLNSLRRKLMGRINQ